MDNGPVPQIFSPRVRRQVLNWWGRLLAMGISGLCLAGLITAALLRPDPSGLSTHTQLGFAACSWYRVLGIPCPFCGMTTSWAWFARGNLAAALWVQPMGTLLAFLTAMVFWFGFYMALTGRPAHGLLRYVPGGYIGICLLSVAAAAWGWKIFIQFRHLDGW